MSHSLPGSPTPRVGMFPPPGLLNQGRDAAAGYLARAEEAGIDYVCCGDHVSFFGLGFDGLVQATALAMLNPTLPVHLGVYLLPLRHPVLVARQLADFAGLAPGRLVLGVGVGGEDRHEVVLCGVDPPTRGSRMDECLAIVRQLLAWQRGEFPRRVLRPGRGGYRALRRMSRFRSSSAVVRTRRSGGQLGWAMAGSGSGTRPSVLPPLPRWPRKRRPGLDDLARRPAMRCRYGAGSRSPNRPRGPARPRDGAFYQLPFERSSGTARSTAMTLPSSSAVHDLLAYRFDIPRHRTLDQPTPHRGQAATGFGASTGRRGACTARPLGDDELAAALAWNMVVPSAVRGAL